jgi:hypothetical protein
MIVTLHIVSMTSELLQTRVQYGKDKVAVPYGPVSEGVRILLAAVSALAELMVSGFTFVIEALREPRWLNRYSDCLWAERLRSRSSGPDRVKNFQVSISSRPLLGSIQPPIQ